MAPPVGNFTKPRSNKERTKWTQHVNRKYDIINLETQLNVILIEYLYPYPRW